MTNPQVFTGDVIIRSKALGIAKRVHVGKYFYRGYREDGVTPLTREEREMEVEFAGRMIKVTDYGQPVYARLVEGRACGIKCQGAVGPSCDCSCGGKNHAGGWA